MITRVRLRNWKSHSETDVVFGDGTNVLVGPMGSGKSSVLEAVAYGLFGTLPSIQSRKIKLEDLITGRPEPRDRAEVEVWFLAPDGEEYAVRRVIERGSGTVHSEVRKANGEVIESHSSSRVNEFVERVLGVGYDLFERAVYSEQNRLDYFLTLQKGRRMESIDELLGINRLDKVRKGIGSLINRMRERIAECRESARRYREERDVREMQLIESELARLEDEIRGLRMRVQELQPELELARARIEELGGLEREVQDAERLVRELYGRMESVARQIEALEEGLGPARFVDVKELAERERLAEEEHRIRRGRVEELGSKLTEIVSGLSRLNAERSFILKALADQNSRIERKRKMLEELKRYSPQALREEIEGLRSGLPQLQERVSDMRAVAAEIERSLRELEGSGPVCPVCEGPLSEERKRELAERKTALLVGLRKEVEDGEREIRRMREELQEKERLLETCSSMERETADLPGLEAEVRDLTSRLSKVDAELAELSRRENSVKEELERAREEAGIAERELTISRKALLLRSQHERMKQDHAKLQEEWKSAGERLRELKEKYDERAMAEARRRWEELYALQGRLQAELEGKERLAAERRRALEGAREKAREARRQELRADHLERSIGMLQTVQAALLRTQTTLRRMFVDGVNEVMSDLWEAIYPYGDFVGIKLDVAGEGKSGDYVLMLRDRGGSWVPVDGMVSGGERTDACLALRIAFSIVLAPNLKWIVFDEPTHNLDAEGIQELAKVLRERLPEVVRQVLLITHEERLESAVSGYLYRFSRDKDADEPTRVEQVAAPESFG